MFEEKVQKRLQLLDSGADSNKLVEFAEREIHLLEVEEGQADLTVLLSSPCILFKKLEDNGLPYFKNRKCADYVLFERKDDNWFVHIFELKRTVKSKSWGHIKFQFSGALQNAYALAGVLGIEIHMDKVKTYTVYRNDKLRDASNPAKIRYQIQTKQGNAESPEQREWNSNTVEIDFIEKIRLEHHKVQLNIETGVGQCQLA